MDYEQFVLQFTQELRINLERNVDIRRERVQKINGNYDGLSIHYSDSSYAPIIYLEEHFQLMQKGYTVEELAENAAAILRCTCENAAKFPKLSADAVKDKLYLVVVNAERNKELLKVVPHERKNDLAIIVRLRVGANESSIVNNKMCQAFKMTSEEVLEQAHKNMEKEKFQCMSMVDFYKKTLASYGISESYADEMIQSQILDCPMYILTNESTIEGAAAIASQRAMEQAYAKLKEEFPAMEHMYVLGSSRHELLLVPDTIVNSVEGLKALHKEVQDTTVKTSEKLTDQIYKYDGLSKKFSVVDAVLSESEAVVKDNEASHARTH